MRGKIIIFVIQRKQICRKTSVSKNFFSFKKKKCSLTLLNQNNSYFCVPINGKSIFYKKRTQVDTLSYKTKSANKATVQKEWFVVDATDQVVGRMCAQIAKIIRGKHKPSFTPNVNCGDGVIVINAEKVKFTE